MPTHGLSLNFSPTHLSGEAVIAVGYRPYSETLLHDLREEFGATHVFQREREDNTIVDIPAVAGTEPLADKVMELDLARSRRYWGPLLNAALVRLFAGKREIVQEYPVEVLGNPKRNYIQHEDLPDWVRILSLLKFVPRTLFNSTGTPNFGLICDVRTRSQLLASCAELLAQGISPVGRYVMIDLPPRDHRVSARSLTVGRVKAIENDTLILEDHREGYSVVAAKDARLTGSRVDFDWCVNQLIPDAAGSVLAAARDFAGTLNAGPGRLNMLDQTLAFLQEENLEAVPGLKFQFGNWITSGDEAFPEVEMIQKPSLVFDPAGTRNSTWNEKGIKDNGPYDQRTFSPKKLNIAVICQGKYEGQVDAFMAKFLDGMPDVKTGRQGHEVARYGDGFLRRFKLERPNVQVFTTNSPSLSGYQSACEAALQQAADKGISWNLAIVQIDESFKDLPGSNNPYYGTKAVLLRNHVAVQSVRIETIREPDTSLVFTMNQLSLAAYAKLGGRPWLLSAQQTVAHELVIGLGSYTESSSRFGAGARYVGITTVFSSDGGYHLSERTGVVPFEGYAEALTETLKRTVQRVRTEDNWKSTDKVRLIFHAFKPLKDLEADAIKAAVEGLGLENVTYAFVHIASEHPFVIFDHDQEGVPKWSQKKKGVLGPSRGLHLKLGDYASLVVFAGASELKQASHGLPHACLLNLHRNSTFRDMTYLARQAFDFTAHSWRVMTPEPLPITIKYSDLIAQRLVGLKQIEGWDDDAVKFREIGRTPWFL